MPRYRSKAHCVHRSEILQEVSRIVPTRAMRSIELSIEGMTCAACAARVERKLNKLDGVRASVNYAAEKANVEAPTGVAIDELVAQVQHAGYRAPRSDLRRAMRRTTRSGTCCAGW